tara:strand:+ start:158 stop:760 length:603 start_codon:yes stop_codon:yes gene_type:complete
MINQPLKGLLLIIILTLNLQSWTKAEDISDFEIEGMSIGDSALDYFTKNEIDNSPKAKYPNKTFYDVFTHSSKFEIYDSVTLSFKTGKYKIYGISGVIDYRSKGFEKCLKDKKNITKEIQATFTNSKLIDSGLFQTEDLTDNKSKRSQVEIILTQNNEVITVDCVDWSIETEKKQGWGDNLSITLYSKEYEKFIRKDAFK